MGLDRRNFVFGGFWAFFMGVLGMRTDPRNRDEIATLKAQVNDLQSQIDQLKRQSLFGGKLQMRPDGTIKLGDIPATIEDDGIHFKDTAYGDGIFWDATANNRAKVLGYSGGSYGVLQLTAERSGATTDEILLGNGEAQINTVITLPGYDVQPASFPTTQPRIWWDYTNNLLKIMYGSAVYSFDVTAV